MVQYLTAGLISCAGLARFSWAGFSEQVEEMLIQQPRRDTLALDGDVWAYVVLGVF